MDKLRHLEIDNNKNMDGLIDIINTQINLLNNLL